MSEYFNVAGYEINEQYNDSEEHLIIDRVTPRIRKNVVRGENNSHYVKFRLKRWVDGIDLTTMLIQVHTQRSDGSGADCSIINVIANEEDIVFGWLIPNRVTQRMGRVEVSIWAIGNTDKGEYIYKTRPVVMEIHRGKNPGSNIPEPKEDWYVSFIRTFDEKIADTQKIVDGLVHIKQDLLNDPNLIGPQGPRGPQGEPGADGKDGRDGRFADLTPQERESLRGPKGDQGERGERGLQGDRGERGEKGDTGDKGEKGDRGYDGQKGDKGEQGEQGPQGERGEKGEQGERGIQGPKGDTGATGPEGLKGDQGERGEQGLPGKDGRDGKDGVMTFAELTAEERESIRGPKGDTGERGEQGPAGRDGTDGLRGLQGDKGDKGDTGERGPQGERGEKGDKGDPGERGQDGTNGRDGDPGPAGPIGIPPNVGTSTWADISVSAQVPAIYTDATSPALSRHGNMVTLDIHTNKANGAITTAQNIFTIPVGYRPRATVTSAIVPAVANLRLQVMEAVGTARSNVRPTVNIANTNNDIRTTMVWITDDEMPTPTR